MAKAMICAHSSCASCSVAQIVALRGSARRSRAIWPAARVVIGGRCLRHRADAGESTRNHQCMIPYHHNRFREDHNDRKSYRYRWRLGLDQRMMSGSMTLGGARPN